MLGEAEKAEADPAASREKALGAAQYFQRAERLCPGDPENAFWSATAFIFAREVAAYREALERVRRTAGPGDVRARYLEAHFHLVIGRRPDLAIDLFEAVRAARREFLPQQLSVHLARARIAYGNDLAAQALALGGDAGSGIFDEPIRQLRLAVRESTGARYAARRNLAQVYRWAQRFAEAQELWEMLAAENPEDAVVRYGLASVLAEQLEHEKSAAQWKETLRLLESGKVAPGDRPDDARLRYGAVLKDALRYREARDELVRYTKEAPNDARGWYHLGILERDHLVDLVLVGPGKAGGAAVAPVVRAVTGVTEEESRALVARAPTAVERAVPEEEAEADRARLVAAGAEAEIRYRVEAAIVCFETALRLDPVCEESMRALLGIYTAMHPDEDRAKWLEARLSSEEEKRARTRVRKQRIMERADRTEGCR
jgi:tetratricopeptide (TPR) repeat protein